MAQPLNTPLPQIAFAMRGVAKSFGATRALKGVSLDVQEGQVHALVGENGAGKSTLMKVLSGAIQADQGEMEVNGEIYRPNSPLAARRAGVAMIYQELALAPHLSVEANISLGLEPHQIGWVRRKKARDRAARALAELGHPHMSLSRPAWQLSIAEQQIVEIARAVANKCRILVLDEPTSSLTREDTQRLFRTIAALKARGHAIVYISHFLEEVQAIADWVTVLRDGTVADSGPIADFPPSRMVERMVGRPVEDLFPRSPHPVGEAILSLQGLTGRKQPQSADLTLHRGEVVGIAGLVGAGRTELLRAIFGLDPVVSGTVRVGTCVSRGTARRRLAEGVGMLSEDRKREGLLLQRSIADNTTLSRLQGLGLPGLVYPKRQLHATRRWIDRLAIRCASASHPVSSLSGGNQQKVALARMLHHDVDVLLLDEPTRGIDVGSKSTIYELIDRLATGEGDRPRAILMVSSYLPELLGTCDRIAVMYRGHLSQALPKAQWTESALLAAATGTAPVPTSAPEGDI